MVDMKSVSWASNVPNMKGKKSILFRDDELWNHREQLNDQFEEKMTREELIDLDRRVMERIKKNGLPSRPISEKERQRFEELKRKKPAQPTE